MPNTKAPSRKRATAKQLSIAYEPLSSLRPDPRNPRIHSEKQVRQIAQSISTFGFISPVLVDRDFNVVAGHGRVLAAKLLELERVPTIRLEHLSENQRRAFMIADNRLTENAAWDERLLGEQLKILSESEIDFSLEITGFHMAEIDIFIEGVSGETITKSDAADTLPEDADLPQVGRTGDCWLLGKHRVLCGNALEMADHARVMAGRKAALVFTDPPYNISLAPCAGQYAALRFCHGIRRNAPRRIH